MIKALATDLDGTLIPLGGDPVQQADLQKLSEEIKQRSLSLAFVTGRHADSAIAAIEEHSLPHPDIIICNVGTTILRPESGRFRTDDHYSSALRALTGGTASERLQKWLEPLPGLQLQEDFKQAEFKLSYYTSADTLDDGAKAITSTLQQHEAAWEIITSVDPFNGDGLIDLLPAGVSKSFAIDWWARGQNLQVHEFVFAGDSGNDVAALTAEWKAILVGNATPQVATEVRRLATETRSGDRLFHSRKSASSGVLDGLRHFLAVHDA